MIAAILLAAGRAQRFGAAKLLQDLNDMPVIRWSAAVVARPPVDEVVVVVPPDHEAIARALDGLAVRIVVNPDPSAGLGSSIAVGVRALGPRVRATLVVLADEPMLAHDVVERVVGRYRPGVAIVAPRYGDVPGHPVLFDRSVFPELARLTGDRGARGVVERDPGRVEYLALDAERPVDVDTPADLDRLRSAGGPRA